MAFKLNMINPILAILIVFQLFAFQAECLTQDEASMSKRHKEWMDCYGRVYNDCREEKIRFGIFQENAEFIDAFNKAATRPYKLAINAFADMTNEEFRARHNGYKMSLHSNSSKTPFRYENVTDVPPSMDWRKKGAVTGVKDQGQCGCCWAFSAVAATEGLNRLKNRELISLSEQELVDCDTVENMGCEGGLMDNAFKYIIVQKGLANESNYPYKGVDDACNYQKAGQSAAMITGYEDVPANSEFELLKAAANQPVSVAIDAGGSAFQFYSSGVFTGDCGANLDHGVTIVGYGTTEEDSRNYWLVKNSWATGWGEEGYIRMERDVDAKEGLCGIAMQASYPTI